MRDIPSLIPDFKVHILYFQVRTSADYDCVNFSPLIFTFKSTNYMQSHGCNMREVKVTDSLPT